MKLFQKNVFFFNLLFIYLIELNKYLLMLLLLYLFRDCRVLRAMLVLLQVIYFQEIFKFYVFIE